jgi:O-methyltransferase
VVSRRQPTEPAFPPDLDPETIETIRAVTPYTLTSIERIAALCASIRYVVDAAIPGAIVECGVWRGGSMMAAARTLVAAGDTSRQLYLYDTFTTMPMPEDRDVDVWGVPAARHYEGPESDLLNPGYAYLPQERVEALMRDTGYPPEQLRFVRGLVEETIPATMPDRIALLRLDTDWYASTAHELAHLFPLISEGGVLIVDDYGHFRGARDAIDEYLAASGLHLLLHRIDWTGRAVVVHRPGADTGG